MPDRRPETNLSQDLGQGFDEAFAALVEPGEQGPVAAAVAEAAATLDDHELARFLDAIASAVAAGRPLNGVTLTGALAAARRPGSA